MIRGRAVSWGVVQGTEGVFRMHMSMIHGIPPCQAASMPHRLKRSLPVLPLLLLLLLVLWPLLVAPRSNART